MPTHVQAGASSAFCSVSQSGILCGPPVRGSRSSACHSSLAHRLSTASVTTFNISSSLTNYARACSTGAGVLIPVATALHATERRNDQQRLFLEGTMYGWFLSLLLSIGLILLGKTFITLWMGSAFAPAAGLLTILIIGEALPMSQFVATGFLMSMNRQRILAALSMSEAIVIFASELFLHQVMGSSASAESSR